MKIRVKRTFQYQIDAATVGTIQPGIHDLDDELALKVLKFGSAEKVLEKVAPENKVVKVAETKEGSGSSAGAKPRKRGRPRKG